MEACDKQFEVYEGHDLPKDPLDVWEDAWRAALEWALNYEVPSEIKERILDELKNT
jgi:hypothetical protein